MAMTNWTTLQDTVAAEKTLEGGWALIAAALANDIGEIITAVADIKADAATQVDVETGCDALDTVLDTLASDLQANTGALLTALQTGRKNSEKWTG